MTSSRVACVTGLYEPGTLWFWAFSLLLKYHEAHGLVMRSGATSIGSSGCKLHSFRPQDISRVHMGVLSRAHSTHAQRCARKRQRKKMQRWCFPFSFSKQRSLSIYVPPMFITQHQIKWLPRHLLSLCFNHSVSSLDTTAHFSVAQLNVVHFCVNLQKFLV